MDTVFHGTILNILISKIMSFLFLLFQERELLYKIFEDFLFQPLVTELKKIDRDV